MNIILSSYLFINAWTDLKRKEIDIVYTIIVIIIGSVYKHIMQGTYYWSGMIPGFLLFLISFIWRKHIGMGDGIIVMTFGWMCGFTFVCDVLTGGFLLAAGVGIICCIVYRTVEIELPFVPFFLVSYLLKLWI